MINRNHPNKIIIKILYSTVQWQQELYAVQHPLCCLLKPEWSIFSYCQRLCDVFLYFVRVQHYSNSFVSKSCIQRLKVPRTFVTQCGSEGERKVNKEHCIQLLWWVLIPLWPFLIFLPFTATVLVHSKLFTSVSLLLFLAPQVSFFVSFHLSTHTTSVSSLCLTLQPSTKKKMGKRQILLPLMASVFTNP